MNYDNFFVISDVFIFLAVTGSVLNLSLCRALKFHARFHTVKFCGMGHSDKSLQTWSVASVNHKPIKTTQRVNFTLSMLSIIMTSLKRKWEGNSNKF